MPPAERHRSAGSTASPIVVAGLLGEPDDPNRLEVTFRIEHDRVRLTTGDTELGSWARADVRMVPGGEEEWSFEAEGDRLPFLPARPAVLRASGLVPETPGPSRSTRRLGLRRPTIDMSRPRSGRPRSGRPRVGRPSLRRPGRRTAAAEETGRRPSLWLRSVDAARRRGLFGLDRLPVDEANRHGDHEHTWDHRAAGSGLAQHLCTICGAVRR